MSEKPPPSIAELLKDTAAITAALERAVRAAVLAHAHAGQPVAEWRDGKTVWVSPEEILSDPYFTGPKKDTLQGTEQSVKKLLG